MRKTGDAEEDRLDSLLARSGIFVEKSFPEEASGHVFISLKILGSPRTEFSALHFAYEPVPEVYVCPATFDRFFPPRKYLSQLRDEAGDSIEVEFFLEALGCHIIPDSRQRQEISSELSFPLPEPRPAGRQGLILICWERIKRAANELGLDEHVGFLHLLDVVCFHEHSHAARESRLFSGGDPQLLQKEEIIAQEEAYMFLRWRGKADAIAAMKKLMEKQPNCYRIRIP